MLLASIRSPHKGMSRTNQISALGYVFPTGQIASLKCLSFTNRTTAFEYLAPTTAFGYCFLVYDVMDQEAVHKE